MIGAVSVGEQSQAINKIWGVENYSRYFLYSVSAPAIGPKEGFAVHLSVPLLWG